MATPFREIYNIFLSNITDYSLSKLPEDVMEENMNNWLMNAISSYPNSNSNVEDYDSSLEQFNTKLTHNEKIILGKLMVVEYINPYIVDETLLREKLGSKDYRSFSPAGHLRSLIEVKHSLEADVWSIISKNSYSIKNLRGKLGGRNERL